MSRGPQLQRSTQSAGGTSVRTALIALLTALIAEQSKAQEDCVALRSTVASDLVDTSRELDMYTIHVSTFNFWLIAVGLLIVILLLVCVVVLGWEILHELRAATRAMPKARREPPEPRFREQNCDSRAVLCRSQTTYRWWRSKPEFRALAPRDRGCWTD